MLTITKADGKAEQRLMEELKARSRAVDVKVTQAVSTIICEGDAIGAVILCSRDEKGKLTEAEGKLAAAAAGFLGRQMEQ